MLLSLHPCLILTVGEIKDKKGFKICHVRVKTKELNDPDSGQLIRASGVFDCEVAINDPEKHKQLKELATNSENYVPCTFMLRSFFYTEKGIEKLGKQLVLKRWWR